MKRRMCCAMFLLFLLSSAAATLLEGPSDVEVQAGEVASFTCKAPGPCDDHITNWHKAGYTNTAGHSRVLRNNSFGDMTIRMECENGVQTSVLTITASEELNQSSFQCLAQQRDGVHADDGDNMGTCYSLSALLTVHSSIPPTLPSPTTVTVFQNITTTETSVSVKTVTATTTATTTVHVTPTSIPEKVITEEASPDQHCSDRSTHISASVCIILIMVVGTFLL